jgi:hypothetical protein
MSNSTREFPALPRRSVTAPQSLVSSIRATAFWIAIVLPFLYLPLLVAGLNGSATTTAFIALLLANVLALFVGHSHLED